MFYPYTDRQARFIALAGELADRFAARAPEQDRTGRFPFENFADIRAARLPGLVVPEDLGGWRPSWACGHVTSIGCGHCSLLAQETQSAASGRASRRLGAIASPQRTHSP